MKRRGRPMRRGDGDPHTPQVICAEKLIPKSSLPSTLLYFQLLRGGFSPPFSSGSSLGVFSLLYTAQRRAPSPRPWAGEPRGRHCCGTGTMTPTTHPLAAQPAPRAQLRLSAACRGGAGEKHDADGNALLHIMQRQKKNT